MNGCEYVLSFDRVNGAAYCGKARLSGFFCTEHLAVLEEFVTIS